MYRRAVEIVVVLGFFVSCCALAHSPAVTRLSVNSHSISRGFWQAVTWAHVDIEDVESFDLSISTIVTIPMDVSRGRCSYQVGMQLPLPHDGVWRVKLLKDDPYFKGGSLPELPFMGQVQNDPTGLNVISAHGPWFVIGIDEIFAPGDRLSLEVFVDGTGSGPYVDSRSWLQCEWVVSSIFIDGFESGTASNWN